MPKCLLVPDLAQLLATRFLILQHSMMSTAEQIKNAAGHQAKYIVVLGIVLKRDWHDQIKGYLPVALTKKFQNKQVDYNSDRLLHLTKKTFFGM